MKQLTLLLFFFYFNAFAQNSEVFRIDSIPQRGVLLDKRWKWHDGDTLWQAINPTLDIRDSIPERVKKQIGKLRLYISLNPSLKNVPLSIQIQQSVAGQYFLNGVKIAESGTINQNPDDVKAKDLLWRPIAFPLKTDTINIFEVHFAAQPNIYFTSVFETANPLTSIWIYESNISQSLYSNVYRLCGVYDYFLIGFCLMIFIIHISFYFLYPLNKANLYFALSRLVYIVGAFLYDISLFFTLEVGHKYWYGNVAFNLYILSNILTLLAVLFYLNRKMDWIDKILIALYVPVIACIFLIYPDGWRIGAIYQMLHIFNLIRIAILSRKTNKIDALIIGLGSLITFISFVMFATNGTFDNNDFIHSLWAYRMILYVIYSIALPIAISIFMAKDFANIALNLKNKLVENETLSSEKQQILATQNETLEKQVKERTSELVASQNQLIQKEKLASLGELTAGIAHEIQNPLNFVNNFSELSVDLAKELKEEIDKVELPEKDKDYIGEILTDLSQNQEKINHHGKRASSIVKGMLEHSRASTGVKEWADINKLADEYLRLAYHGFKAKDKDFNADFKTDFDENLLKIEVIPQDIGRVLLNLINNAFYAVHQRKLLSTDESYTPSVSVTTHYLPPPLGAGGASIIIKVKDNGTGMPESVRAKVFQPFFTTKPTGSGTGLGLSLAYDIVTKGHGGTLEVVSTVANPDNGGKGVGLLTGQAGSEFIISLPFKTN